MYMGSLETTYLETFRRGYMTNVLPAATESLRKVLLPDAYVTQPPEGLKDLKLSSGI